jgi:hypothetical protein
MLASGGHPRSLQEVVGAVARSPVEGSQLQVGSTIDRTRLSVRRIVVASPRGYCAGVERAVETVEEALDLWGPPIYVRKQIVHNVHVVRDLERRGVVFVESEDEVPRSARVVFSAHGVAPTSVSALGAVALRRSTPPARSWPRCMRRPAIMRRGGTRSS